MKAVAELLSSTPRPAIAMADTRNTPAALPSEPHMARRGPTDTELDTASSTAGPGVKAMKSETPQKTSQLDQVTITPCNAADAAAKSARHCVQDRQPAPIEGLARRAGG